MSAPRVLCITGPTASGKTALAVSVAKHLGGEIISCDSMQIYRYLSIGTAKPTTEEMDGIPHHMLDFVDPRTPFSCADYVATATQCAHDILSRGKLPIFCGGTGLYLDHTIKGTTLSAAPGTDTTVRDALLAEYRRDGIDGIYKRLSALDPDSADAIHKNNTKRVLRALEIYLVTGKPKSAWDRDSQSSPLAFNACHITLDYHDRSILHDRINRRVDLMLDLGLLDEVKRLYAAGYLPDGSTAAQAIGYKEFLFHLRGEMTLLEATEHLRAATRQYAKRQLTWFRKNGDAHVLYPDLTPNGTDAVSFLTDEVVRIYNTFIEG